MILRAFWELRDASVIARPAEKTAARCCVAEEVTTHSASWSVEDVTASSTGAAKSGAKFADREKRYTVASDRDTRDRELE